MDSQSSRQSPPRSKNERVRVQKIRNCCDACSVSKTKCDQTRPTCARCQKNGLECNYSISQRKGKPPAASRNLNNGLNARKTSQDKHTPEPIRPSIETPMMDFHHSAVSPHSFGFEQDTAMSDILLTSFEDVVPPFSQHILPDFSDYSGSGWMTPNSMFDSDLAPMGTPNMAPVMDRSMSSSSNDNMFNLFDKFPGIEPPQIPSPMEYPFPTTSNPLPTPPTHSNPHSPSPRLDCAKLASSTLESLNLNVQACKHTAPTASLNTASLDRILIANKAAVKNTQELLSCPCSLSQQSNLLISCIIDKILGLYQSTIRAEAYSGTPPPPSAPSAHHHFQQMHHHHRYPTSSPSPDGSDSRGVVAATPITIGAYQMDAKDEQRMRMQLISNELRKVAGLVEKYAERYQGLASRQQDREDSGVQCALADLLKRKLREVGVDLQTALRAI